MILRGLQIFGLAFLFRLQACILSWGPWWTLLKVDILNIMGPSIMATAALWRAGSSMTGRALIFGVATVTIALLTPPIRANAALAALPNPIEAYIRPVPGLSNFIFLPWAAFVFAGAIVGVFVDGSRTSDSERRLNLRFGALGAALGGGAYAASYVPSLYPTSHFWSTSPAFFFLRTGILVALVGLAYAWQHRPGGEIKWSPLQQLGRTSLFIYWIHIELIYGLMTRPIHKTFSLPAAWVAVIAFSLFMLACSLLKERVVARLRAPRVGVV